MSPKEFRERQLQLMENGLVFAYQLTSIGGRLIFSPNRLVDTDWIPVSIEEVRLMFQEDKEREKAELN